MGMLDIYPQALIVALVATIMMVTVQRMDHCMDHYMDHYTAHKDPQRTILRASWANSASSRLRIE
jgi:hypothetical protein